VEDLGLLDTLPLGLQLVLALDKAVHQFAVVPNADAFGCEGDVLVFARLVPDEGVEALPLHFDQLIRPHLDLYLLEEETRVLLDDQLVLCAHFLLLGILFRQGRVRLISWLPWNVDDARDDSLEGAVDDDGVEEEHEVNHLHHQVEAICTLSMRLVDDCPCLKAEGYADDHGDVDEEEKAPVVVHLFECQGLYLSYFVLGLPILPHFILEVSNLILGEGNELRLLWW